MLWPDFTANVTGIVLLLLGVLGVVQFGIPGFLSINELAEITVHFVSGALATYAGFSRGYGRAAVLYARVFGIGLALLRERIVHPARTGASS